MKHLVKDSSVILCIHIFGLNILCLGGLEEGDFCIHILVLDHRTQEVLYWKKV